ncbi:hypothetical protein APHAL10511_002028 [Amanita phalloides]|nr:hypothetical protein APHAL10511_002028 [Amanita phalloides]
MMDVASLKAAALRSLYDANGGLLASTVAMILSIFLAFLFYKKRPIAQNPKERRYGEWIPVPFSYPAITPHEKQLVEIKPVSYRPYRWGPYHITMGIRKMEWDEWIELDDQYERYQRIRAHRIATRGEKAVRVLGDTPGLVRGGGEAAVELVHELAEYLSRRYPLSFQVTRHGSDVRARCQYGWDGAPPIRTISVLPLNATHHLPLTEDDGKDAAKRALTISALLIQDDLAILIEGKDGKYYFQAGAICVPGFWRMEDKLGKALDEIHISGNVPRYEEKLQTSMERYFRRLAVNKPVARNNYFMQVVPSASDVRKSKIDAEELAWSESTLGPEDEYGEQQGGGGDEATVERVRLRTERQTLRRLARSGGIVFTIRVYVVGMSELREEGGEGARLASAVRSWPEDVAAYKKRSVINWSEVTEYLASP